MNDVCSTPALQLKVLNNATEQECACALGVLRGVYWTSVVACERSHLQQSSALLYSIFRQDIFQRLVHLQNFQNQFLPNALRQFFREVSAPDTRGDYLSTMMDGFSERFCSCNPKLGLTKGE